MSVISNNSSEMHNVSKYSFKVIPLGSNSQEEENTDQDTQTQKYTKDNHPGIRATDIDSSELSTSSKESLIESLMKKTEEMSSNFIKLQMKLEAKEEEYKRELQKAKEAAFEEGIQAGIAKAIEEGELNVKDALKQFSSSIKKLEESARDFEFALEGIKNELTVAALDISKEVLKIELSSNSGAVAKSLSEELIKELQSASKITLKVNPKDHGVISEYVGLTDHVKVVSDSAISEGGVVAISEAGNIDAEISKRFERIKKAVLSE